MGFLTDNPELVRYVRVGTRKGKATAIYMVFLLACVVCVVANVAAHSQYLAYASTAACFRSIFFQIVVTNFVLVLIFGAHACGESISQERQADTLEFQRLTGMSAYRLALGKILGCPLIHYLLAVVGMPFTMLCVIAGGVSMTGYLATYALLVVSGMMFSSAAALLSSFRRGKTTKGRTSPVVLLVLLLIFGPAWFSISFRLSGMARPGGLAFYTCLLPYHSLVAVGRGSLGAYQVSLFGTTVNGIVATLVINTLLFLFCWAGTARRMASDSQPVWSKKQLIVSSAVLYLLMAGMVWSAMVVGPSPWSAVGAAPLAPVCYATIVAHVWLLVVAVVASPNLHPYRVGLRRRLTAKTTCRSLLDDRTMALPFVALVAAGYALMMLLVVPSTGAGSLTSASAGTVASFFIPLVLCAVLYAEAAQAFKLLAPEHGTKLLAAVLLLWTALPIIGGLVAMATAQSALAGGAATIMMLSPVGAGIGALGSDLATLVQGDSFWGATALFAIAAAWLWAVLKRQHELLARQVAETLGTEWPPSTVGSA